MNLIDNGIKEVLHVERDVLEEEVYFSVKFIDYYNRERVKRFGDIKNLERKSWVE